MKKRMSVAKKALYWVIVIIAIFIMGYMAYSVIIFKGSEAEKEGIVVCDRAGQNCLIAPGDLHAEIDAEICGDAIRFPLEKGDLSKQHTHKEKNLIHWHDKLPYDKATNTILDWSPLKLSGFFEQMEMRFNSSFIDKYCNGDRCPSGSIGKLKMTVNGADNFEFENYVWKDDDRIDIRFG